MPVYFLYIDHCLKIGNHLVYNIKLLPPQQFLESKFCHRFTITSNSRCYYISKISEQEGGLHWFCLRKLFSSRALIQEKSSDGFALLNVFCTLLFLQNFCETLDASSEWDSFAVSLLKLTKIHFRLHSVTYSKTPTQARQPSTSVELGGMYIWLFLHSSFCSCWIILYPKGPCFDGRVIPVGDMILLYYAFSTCVVLLQLDTMGCLQVSFG